MARRRTTKRTRRNPIRTTGALIINPRRRKRNPARRTRRNALQIRTNRKRRTNRRRTRKNALQIRTNRRRSRRRNPRSRRRNGTRRGMRRRTARRAYSKRRNTRSRRRNTRVRRRNGTRRGMRRRTSRRAYAKRRNRRTRKNMGTMLKKIPVIGGVLASMVSLAPTALFGGIMVEPTMLGAALLGRYIPNLPAPLYYVLAGLVVGALVKAIPSRFLASATKDKLAIAAASAAGGVAYYKFRTSGGLTETVADEVGALELRGYSGPLGLLELRGLSGLGGGFSGAYGDYGPAAVMPLGTY